MATLHIEHAITDDTSWKAAFDRFADCCREAGVTTNAPVLKGLPSGRVLVEAARQ